jgi:hypothetical protein
MLAMPFTIRMLRLLVSYDQFRKQDRGDASLVLSLELVGVHGLCL